ncbi:MAG: SOSS complex subunit B family protein [Nanoarchaeota archaeon]
MAKVSDLKAGQGKVDIEVVVKSKAETRTFNKYGKDLKVANAIVGDESGEISFSLWNDDIEKVKVGDKIKITNGYVSEFNGQKQLTSGKFGKMEVISSSDSPSDSSVSPASSSVSPTEEDSKKSKGKKGLKKEKEPKQDSDETSESSTDTSDELEF